MKRSPYDLLREADEKMKTMILDLDRRKEERVIVLINAAASYPDMSAYQVMKTRLFLLDLYISHSIYGSALDLCRLMLEEYPRAPVRRKMKDLQKIRDENPEDLVFSADVNLTDPELSYCPPDMLPLYDEEFEEEVEERLNRLPEGCRDAFYLSRQKRTSEDAAPFSSHDIDVMNLCAMEESYFGRIKK